jgi:hypothetical protein
VRRQAEIVVCTKIKRLSAVHGNLCTLRGIDDALCFVKAGYPDLVKFNAYAAGEAVVHGKLLMWAKVRKERLPEISAKCNI